MNRRTIFLFSFFIGLVLLALICVQLYWVTNAIRLTEQHFEQDVNDALNDAVYRLEKTSVAKLTEKYNFRKQAVRWVAPQQSTTMPGAKMVHNSADNPSYKVNSDKYNVKVYEELSSDSNGVVTSKMKHSYLLHDTNSNGAFDLGIKFSGGNALTNSDSIDKKLQWAMHRGDVMNDIFDELVSINVYHDVNPHIDTAMVDSLLRSSLADQNIRMPYHFGILNSNKDTVLEASAKGYNDEFLKSPYMVNISPKSVFMQHRYLALYFPKEGIYSRLSESKFIVLSSIAIILIIIGSFYYTISTIFKQKKLSEVKNDFINNMTHEFKTPISTISLASEVLGDKTIEKSEETEERYLKIIRNENKRLGGMVENILQAATLDKGELKLKIQEVDVHQVIRDVLQSLNLQIQNKQGEAITELNAQRYSLFADKMHLGNIIYNLIDNALKYCTGTPHIVISTQNDSAQLIISVKDNGIGIKKDDQKKIFDTFYRVPTGNVHNVKGFGLGLSYVKAVVEKHGGHIEVDSEINKGSTFVVYLPFSTNLK
ncbi:MAG TPA: HAMP domain-containing sensor histidine kinase [Bacteroidia bacterium]|jgi:two-component system phosphate regulon sensor histidine kinase PhoR|nr:HAMP domain-containing sensor histidine kinase [Bacteroidia bacterium]